MKSHNGVYSTDLFRTTTSIYVVLFIIIAEPQNKSGFFSFWFKQKLVLQGRETDTLGIPTHCQACLYTLARASRVRLTTHLFLTPLPVSYMLTDALK